MISAGVVALLAFGVAGFTYLWLERLGPRAWVPLLCRGIAWSALGILLLNLSCQVQGAPLRPLVLLDASLSLGAAGGRWAAAHDSAAHWGEVRTFGDERLIPDSVPTRGRSTLAPALLAAASSERPVIVVTDGEIDDQLNIPPDILARSGVRLFPREARPDLAVVRVSGPDRVSADDSIPLDVAVEAIGGAKPDTAVIEVVSGGKTLATRTIRFRGGAASRTRLLVPSRRLTPGDHVLRVGLAQGRDAEPRTDARLHLVQVAASPGVVFLASPADWDSRFLYRTLREVGQLPIRGYTRLDRDRWRAMSDLRPVSAAEVRRAVRGADLLVLKGQAGTWATGSRARGILSWPSGEGGEATIAGDWYLSAAEDAPLSGAFLGQPIDSFPPAFQLTPVEPGTAEWVALYAQLGRRGPRRPAVIGSQRGTVRQVHITADGLWRWAFRGGASEQTYRSWVAATTSWLLGGADPGREPVRPVDAVVANGRPFVFQWVGERAPTPQIVTWSTSPLQRVDTLRFDAAGRATVWLPPGEYRYRLGSGNTGTVAVEQFSDELLPHPITLSAHEPRIAGSSRQRSARELIWLFGLCIAALSGEWLARRRLGLR